MSFLYRILLIAMLLSNAVAVAVAATAAATIGVNQTYPSTKSEIGSEDVQGDFNYEEKGETGEMAVDSTSAIPSQSPSPSIPACDVDCATGDSCLHEPPCFQYCKEACGY